MPNLEVSFHVVPALPRNGLYLINQNHNKNAAHTGGASNLEWISGSQSRPGSALTLRTWSKIVSKSHS